MVVGDTILAQCLADAVIARMNLPVDSQLVYEEAPTASGHCFYVGTVPIGHNKNACVSVAPCNIHMQVPTAKSGGTHQIELLAFSRSVCDTRL